MNQLFPGHCPRCGMLMSMPQPDCSGCGYPHPEQKTSTPTVHYRVCIYAWDWGRAGEGATYRHFTPVGDGSYETWTVEVTEDRFGTRAEESAREIWTIEQVTSLLRQLEERLRRIDEFLAREKAREASAV